MKLPKEGLIELLKSTDKPLSVGEILRDLSEQFDVRPSTVRQMLRDLEKEKKIVSFTEEKGAAGRPRKLYRPIQVESVREDETLTREIIERRSLLRELINDSAGRYSTMPFEQVQAIFRTAAERLLKEDPRNLFMKFALWLKQKHKVEVELYKKNRDSGLRREGEKHRRNIERLEKCADVVYTRALGVPTQIRESGTLKPGPFRLKFNWRASARDLEDESHIDNNELRIFIEYSVHGPSVIEVFSISDLKPPFHIGGSDASAQPITLSRLLPWLIERSEMNIITAVGVRYDVYNDVRDFDRQPEPRVLAEYERAQAIEEGLLIPPSGTLGYRPEMETRIREAAMDLRQYIKDFDLMFSNEPSAKIHFRDGRIFPMEHRLSDALQLGLHGDLVRSSLKAFRNITNIIGTENGETLYCGFVKRSGIAIVAPLVMWYIGFGSAKGSEQSLDPDMTLEEYLRSPYTDNYVVNQLFSVLRDTLGENEIHLTFRILRRYQSMEEPIVQNFIPSADRNEWYKRLGELKSYIFGGSSEETGLELIANLCARAAIVQVYCSLSLNPYYEPHARLPRVEFLLPFPDFEDALKSPLISNERQVQYIKKILSVLFYSGILVNYQDSLFYFSDNSPEVFLVPKPLYEAHDAAKLIAREYRDDFIELLIREARIYWMTRGHRGFIA